MSYTIEVSYMEIEEISSVKIHGRSQHFDSVRICTLQCIGWLWKIREKVESVLDTQHLENPEYFQEALTRIAGMSTYHAAKVSALKTEKEVFEYTWSILTEEQKQIALDLNPEYYDNFWTCFTPKGRKLVTYHPPHVSHTKGA